MADPNSSHHVQKDEMTVVLKHFEDRIKDVDKVHTQDKAQLIRFLQRRKWDLDEAEKLFRTYVKWREEVKPEQIRKIDFKEELETGKMFLHGTDRDGRPCLIIFPFKHDPNTSQKELCVKMCIYWIEKAIKKMRSGITQYVIIFDLKHSNKKNVDFSLVKEFARLQDFYTQRLHAFYVIRKTWVFTNVLLPVLRNILDKRTVSKFVIMGNDFKDKLKKHFADDQLLPEHGGTSTMKFNSQMSESFEDITKALNEQRLEAEEENDPEKQRKITREILMEVESTDPASLGEAYKQRIKEALHQVMEIQSNKEAIMLNEVHSNSNSGKTSPLNLSAPLANGNTNNNRGTESLRTKAEVIQLDIALLAIKKHELELKVREAEKALKEIPVIEDQLQQKHNLLASTIKEIKSIEELENKLSILKDSSRRRELYEGLPNIGMSSLNSGNNKERAKIMVGSEGHGQPHSIKKRVVAKSVSLYPTQPNIGRLGDPIADRFHVALFSNSAILALADGCGWGTKARDAATTATQVFVEFMRNFSNELTSTLDTSKYMLRAYSAAHDAILKGSTPETVFSHGTTTMLAGVVTPVDTQPDKWIFLFVNIGDCKAFLYTKKSGAVTDITTANRRNISDCTDPGGRIGPYKEGGEPDLRNLKLYSTICEEGDFLILVSDGVHDNLDPQYLGKTPSEFSLEAEDDSWDKCKDPKAAQQIKTKVSVANFTDIVTKKVKTRKPECVVEALINYAIETTEGVRSFMEKNPGSKQPEDYRGYPGKMDHATAVVYRVGNKTTKKST